MLGSVIARPMCADVILSCFGVPRCLKYVFLSAVFVPHVRYFHHGVFHIPQRKKTIRFRVLFRCFSRHRPCGSPSMSFPMGSGVVVSNADLICHDIAAYHASKTVFFRFFLWCCSHHIPCGSASVSSAHHGAKTVLFRFFLQLFHAPFPAVLHRALPHTTTHKRFSSALVPAAFSNHMLCRSASLFSAYLSATSVVFRFVSTAYSRHILCDFALVSAAHARSKEVFFRFLLRP